MPLYNIQPVSPISPQVIRDALGEYFPNEPFIENQQGQHRSFTLTLRSGERASVSLFEDGHRAVLTAAIDGRGTIASRSLNALEPSMDVNQLMSALQAKSRGALYGVKDMP